MDNNDDSTNELLRSALAHERCDDPTCVVCTVEPTAYTPDFDSDAFKRSCEVLKVAKQQALVDALVQLETAAWSRRWMELQVARGEIERLTGITIVGPLKRELRELEG